MGRGRPKKALDNMTGHWTKEQIEQKKYEENLIKIDDKNIKAPNWLKDRVAKNEFKRLVGLLEKIDIICELDITTLGLYCQTYAKLVEIVKELEQEELVIDGKPNPKMKMQLQLSEELRKLGNELGITLSSRLKFATSKAEQERDQIKDEFGDI